MQRTDLGTGLGAGVQYMKYTITYSDLAQFSGSGAKTLTLQADPGGNAFNPAQLQIPQGGTVLFSRINCTAAFTGGSLSAMTIVVGTSGTTNAIQASHSIFTTGCFDTHGMNAELNSNAAAGIQIVFTPTSDNVSAATAGSFDLYIAMIDVTTPTA